MSADARSAELGGTTSGGGVLLRATGAGADAGGGIERGGTIGAGVNTVDAGGGVCVGGGVDAAVAGAGFGAITTGGGAAAWTGFEATRVAGRAGSGGANSSISSERPTKPIATAAAP